MSYIEITRNEKENIPFQCVPFCIEHSTVSDADPVHVHNYHQLSIVTKGSADLIVNNYSCKVQAGSVYVISSYAPHHLEQVDHIEVINILFSLDDLMKYAASLQQSEGFRSLFIFQASTSLHTRPNNILTLNFEGIQEVLHLADAMLKEANNSALGQDIVIQSYFMLLITYLSRSFDLDTESEQSAYAFYRLTEHINRNFAEQYTMSDLVKLSLLNEKHLRSLFMKKYHCSPMQYINRTKLEKARYYFITTDMNISEVAHACGFDDSNYFSRKFKQEFGVSPREFKQKVGG